MLHSLRLGFQAAPRSLYSPVRSYSRYVRTAPKTASTKTAVKPAPPIEDEVTQQDTPSDELQSTTSTASFAFQDAPPETRSVLNSTPNNIIDWSDSYHGLGSQPFSKEIADILLTPIEDQDIEIKPDGLLYLPEIKYRRILNKAFGPGGWGLVPRTESLVTKSQISREYGLICHGRLISIARGEQDYFGGEEKVTTALEGCKSNALMRCCKDLGIASELWDPGFIRKWKAKYCEEVFVEHVVNKKKKKLWKLKSNKKIDYPYKQL
ncbi:Mgm101 protein [Candida orthopsilosis Co 90-125]|uniref:Mitochondrial genome maintenance protein MGM101 n=1 Tax=Candida orthopsilosis (strain 90-125) TaxID=1136231 RepID=H8X1T4_CANO9|nr:Mgm101 protein [Candida orthopsilosis Co 90-125]CCG22489.1 Mgm101 protein [Candida orthopsilosis Co 90-125]